MAVTCKRTYYTSDGREFSDVALANKAEAAAMTEKMKQVATYPGSVFVTDIDGTMCRLIMNALDYYFRRREPAHLRSSDYETWSYIKETSYPAALFTAAHPNYEHILKEYIHPWINTLLPKKSMYLRAKTIRDTTLMCYMYGDPPQACMDSYEDSHCVILFPMTTDGTLFVRIVPNIDKIIKEYNTTMKFAEGEILNALQITNDEGAGANDS